MNAPTIYHGTPLTPRAALHSMQGRAFCVSFWRPDDVEVVEALSPTIMFRQRRLLRVAGSNGPRRAMVRARGLVALLRLARAAAFPAGSMVGHPRRAGRTFSDQRRPSQRMAVRDITRISALAHGRANRPLPAPCRSIRPGLPGVDRRVGPFDGQGAQESKGGRLRGLLPSYGRTRQGHRQSLASDAHDARRACGARVPLLQRGRDITRAERPSL